MRNETKQYIEMQKNYYQDEKIASEDIVGNYEWQENFPYETQLLYRRGDIRKPLLSNMENKSAIDFGCGPGRMVQRMSHFFKQVDGVDISQPLLIKAGEAHPKSNFYLSTGDDLGSTPTSTYDFAYSTIAMQHIAVHSIRMNILKEIKRVLKKGGKFTIQMAFNADYPYILNKGNIVFGDYKYRVFKKDKDHAFWKEDRVTATGTNASCDVAISYQDIPDVINDFENLFDEVDFWFYDVRLIYKDLDGAKHGPGYWPTHWIFISGVNNAELTTKNTDKDNHRRDLWTQKNNELNVRDKNSLFEKIKNIARKSQYYESTKKYIKNKILI